MYGGKKLIFFLFGGGVGGWGTSALIRLRVERFMGKKRKLLATLFVDAHVLRL